MSKKWSREVTNNETTGSEFLPKGLFDKSAEEIAEEIKKAVHLRYKEEGLESSGEYRSAMSMLDFYINRAGKNLTEQDRKRLELAKSQLQKMFSKA